MTGEERDRLRHAVDGWENAEKAYREKFDEHYAVMWGDEMVAPAQPMTQEAMDELNRLRAAEATAQAAYEEVARSITWT